MPKFAIEFTFSMTCRTRGYTVEAASREEANALAEKLVEDENCPNDPRLDTSRGSWYTCRGSDCDYAFDADEQDTEEDPQL